MKHIYQNIPGWFFAEVIYIDAVLRAPEGAHFVEVGSWKGKSTSFLAVEIANSGKHIQFDAVDNWLGSTNIKEQQVTDPDVVSGTLFEVFQKNIEPVAQYVNPIRMDSATAALLYKDNSIDFIYIDGAHDYASVRRDIEAWLPKLKSDGLIAGDDFREGYPGVIQAVTEIFGQNIQVIQGNWIVDNRTGKDERQLERKFDILVRTHSTSSLHDGKRVVDVPKSEIIERCLNSLVKSANASDANIAITVFDDHSDATCIDQITAILKTSKHPTTLIQLEDRGAAASLRACCEFVRDYARDIVYFVEDDYLHELSAIGEMIESFRHFKKNMHAHDVAIFPVDYPDRYMSGNISESRIVLGPERHWRTIEHSTYTFMIARYIVITNWPLFEELWKSRSEYVSEDETVNQLWGKVVLFSPIPSLAVHLQFKEQEPPFVDWRKLWEASKFK